MRWFRNKKFIYYKKTIMLNIQDDSKYFRNEKNPLYDNQNTNPLDANTHYNIYP